MMQNSVLPESQIKVFKGKVHEEVIILLIVSLKNNIMAIFFSLSRPNANLIFSYGYTTPSAQLDTTLHRGSLPQIAKKFQCSSRCLGAALIRAITALRLLGVPSAEIIVMDLEWWTSVKVIEIFLSVPDAMLVVCLLIGGQTFL